MLYFVGICCMLSASEVGLTKVKSMYLLCAGTASAGVLLIASPYVSPFCMCLNIYICPYLFLHVPMFESDRIRPQVRTHIANHV